MLTLFVLFMIFIFRGYHHSKYIQRLEEEARQKQRENEEAQKDKLD